MTRHATVGVVLVGVLVLSFGVGTYGATQVSGERSVTVDIADEGERPYLGVTVHSPRLSNGRHAEVTLLTLDHRLAHADTLRLTWTVSQTAGDPTPPNVRADPESRILGVGDSETLTASVVCGSDPGAEETFTVDVTAEGTRTTIEFSRAVVVTCTGDPNRGRSDSNAG